MYLHLSCFLSEKPCPTLLHLTSSPLKQPLVLSPAFLTTKYMSLALLSTMYFYFCPQYISHAKHFYLMLYVTCKVFCLPFRFPVFCPHTWKTEIYIYLLMYACAIALGHKVQYSFRFPLPTFKHLNIYDF